jgi:CHRD domain
MKKMIAIFVGMLCAILLWSHSVNAILIPSAAKAYDQSFGDQTFTQYEAYLHPRQEPGESFVSPAKGYGKLTFAKNLSYGKVEVQMAGVDPGEIVGFHIHCGPPGVLGPIVVNFGSFGDFKKTIVNGKFATTIKNENVTFIKKLPAPLPESLPKLPESCPIDINLPGPAQVNTIAGVEALARKGVLYFNVHTKKHQFYGEMRAQVYPMET